MLLDTASLYFRAYFGVPESLTAPDGTPNNAIRGLLDFVARLVTDRRPTHLVACDDFDWRPDFRVAALPSYKAHRVLDEDPEAEQVPDTLAPQVPVIWDVLGAIGFACVGVDGHEADDVIGTLATHATMPVDVVTGDRDLFQLVDDARKVRILYTARGVGKHEIVDESVVAEKYGIPGRSYADFALLRGDPSDGLPGVPGIGDKSAASLITRYRTLDNLLAAMENGDAAIPRGQRTKLEAARDYLAAAPVVVQVARDLPMPAYDDRLPSEVRDPERLVELCERWGLESPVNRVLGALGVTIGD
jgi:5'-3' exonuclease